MDLDNTRLRQLLKPYGIEPSAELAEMIREYISLLLSWNAKMALTTICDPDEISRVHFGESFFAKTALGIEGGRLADIGTGAGFPGIPIRMVSPNASVLLVEINAKKSAFLHEVVRKLGLKSVEIMRCRMEEIKLSDFDFITARALGNYEKLLSWSHEKLKSSGKLGLLLGEEETRRLMGNTSWNWDPPIRIPDSKGKFLLAGHPK